MSHSLRSSVSIAPNTLSGSKPLSRLLFTKQQRLLEAKEFSALFADAPIRASHPCFLLLCNFNSTEHARLGLVIAKKQIKKSHDRNRLKRLIRESFRLYQHKLPLIDAIVLARKGADALSNSEIQVILHGLWKRISKRATHNHTESTP
ncbi:MAG TPA: ribonuclease P protein component [Cellvibrionaceae bacterium]|nr:ribonuclease P protein component [Cellvibrionaceae bacterium]